MRKLMLSTLAVLAVATAVYAQRSRELLITTDQPAVEAGVPTSNLNPLGSNFDQFGQPPRAGFIKAGRIYLKRDRIVSIEHLNGPGVDGRPGPLLQVWVDGRGEAVLLRGKSIEDLATALGMPDLVPEKE